MSNEIRQAPVSSITACIVGGATVWPGAMVDTLAFDELQEIA
jgi:hypothetical protein